MGSGKVTAERKDGARKDGALKGLRVLDLGNFMAAPIAAMYLGDFGAEVIKVEHPRGDGLRHWGRLRDGDPLYWKLVSRNKRCVTLNLKEPEGQALLRDLARQADVVIENFTPGVMDGWNIGWKDLSAVNPRLVMLSISAYGQTGPYAARPGFGTLAEALSGYAHITGDPDGPPVLPAFGLADGLAGLNGAFGVLAALRWRDRTGEGQHVDATLYEPLITLLGPQVIEYDQLGVVQGRLGSRLPFSAPRNVYRTQDDKWLAMSCSAQSVFERTMRAIGRADVLADPRFVDNRARGENFAELDALIGDWVAARPLATALEILVAAEAAAAPVYDVADVVADPHFQARGSIAAVEDAKLGTVRMQAPTPRLSATPGDIAFAGPSLGEHNAEIYGALLGLTGADLDGLKARNVI